MKYCIDTNIFFSFQKDINLGKNPSEVMNSILKAAHDRSNVFLMPPKIEDEVILMIDESSRKTWSQLATYIVKKSPQIYTHSIGATLLYEFVNDYRKRAYDGLKIAEDVVVQVAKGPCGETNKVEFEKSLQPIKESLRNRYRNATRTGTIDSVADLDLVMLALEEDAVLITADEGVIVWGRKFGVKEMSLTTFGESIRALL